MRRWLGICGVLIGLSFVVLGSAPTVASAQDSETRTTTLTPEEQARLCASHQLEGFGDAECTFGEDGSVTVTRVEEVTSGGSSSGPSLRFLLGFVVWIVIPLGLAAWLAQSRGQSIVIAVVLTMLLSWIGLFVVFAFLGKRIAPDARPL